MTDTPIYRAVHSRGSAGVKQWTAGVEMRDIGSAIDNSGLPQSWRTVGGITDETVGKTVLTVQLTGG